LSLRAKRGNPGEQNPNDKQIPNIKIQNSFGHLYFDEKNYIFLSFV